MITHTIESYWIPSQKKTKSKLQIKTFAKISNFLILKWALHPTHLLKLLDKMGKYEKDPMSTDRRTRWYQYTPFQLRWSGGYNNCGSWLRKSSTNWQQQISSSHKLSQWLLVTVHRNHLFWKTQPKEFPHKVAVLPESVTWDQSTIIQKHIYEIETQFSYIFNINRVQIQ